ncbi:MAG: DUF1508 domain-containing protein [Pyrinomonadaceae bacterium]
MKYVIYKDASSQYRWRFVASNGRIISDSGESYFHKSDCERGIEIMKNSANAPVVDTTTQSVGSFR